FPIRYNKRDIFDMLIDYNNKKLGISILDIIDKHGYSALHYSIIHGSLYTVEKLIKNGANMYLYDKSGYNSLHLSIIYQKYNILKFLLDNNIDINTKTIRKETGLFLACSKNYEDIVLLLINLKANLNDQT